MAEIFKYILRKLFYFEYQIILTTIYDGPFNNKPVLI